MPTCYLAPAVNTQFFLASGVPANGAKLFSYTAGTTTKTTVYTGSTGTTPWANPIVLDSGGNLPSGNEVWIPAGVSVKFVLAPSNDTDPPTSAYWTKDNISGINDTSAQTEWVAGPTPTFIGATQFTLVGDQTGNFHVNRRLKLTITAGTVYGRILTSVFTSLTTVTLVMDSGVLDSGLGAVSYGVLRADNQSIPILTTSVTSIAAAATVDLSTATGNSVTVTGTGGPITSLGTVQAGAIFIITTPASVTFTHSTSIICPGAVSITTGANDTLIVQSLGAGNWRVINFSGRQYIYIREQQTAGTSGGASVIGQQTRVLNTKVFDTGGNATLASNQITLSAGTYRVQASAPCIQSDRHRIVLYNVTDAAVVVSGKNGIAPSATAFASGNSLLSGRFTIAAGKALEVRQFIQTALAATGLGLEMNSQEGLSRPEIYTEIEFWKEG